MDAFSSQEKIIVYNNPKFKTNCPDRTLKSVSDRWRGRDTLVQLCSFPEPSFCQRLCLFFSPRPFPKAPDLVLESARSHLPAWSLAFSPLWKVSLHFMLSWYSNFESLGISWRNGFVFTWNLEGDAMPFAIRSILKQWICCFWYVGFYVILGHCLDRVFCLVYDLDSLHSSSWFHVSVSNSFAFYWFLMSTWIYTYIVFYLIMS